MNLTTTALAVGLLTLATTVSAQNAPRKNQLYITPTKPLKPGENWNGQWRARAVCV